MEKSSINLDSARNVYIQEFLRKMNMPKEPWIFETAYNGLLEELNKIENKYLHPERDKLLEDLWGRQNGQVLKIVLFGNIYI